MSGHLRIRMKNTTINILGVRLFLQLHVHDREIQGRERHHCRHHCRHWGEHEIPKECQIPKKRMRYVLQGE